MEKKKPLPKTAHTSWQKVHNWYDSIVGREGHYYHQAIIIPRVLKLLNLKPGDNVLDLACGQGVLARHVPKEVHYTGVDAAADLIRSAKQYHRTESNRTFICKDVCQKLDIDNEIFSHATIILALQNIEDTKAAIKNMYYALKKGASAILVLNHPCFRIPRQSDWTFNEKTKILMRSMNCYMSDQKIPIQMKPSQQEQSENTWSFHHPLSYYFNIFKECKFVVETMEEWCSDKQSTGGAAKWENRARDEFPLFMALKLRRE